MISRYHGVAHRISEELAALDRLVARAERAMALARQRPEDQDLYLDSVALSLHDFYTAMERVFGHIASIVDGALPSGQDWHQELLRQMAGERPGVRPAVISEDTLLALDEYRRFRHVVRNIYAFQFDPVRLERLVNGLASALSRVRSELGSFADFLKRLAATESEGSEPPE
ncbi:MAG TPA: hypothetical protein GX513_07990 [Firmicutes bacterium]|nr:hypothetical protein [Bacillota bacterium]